MRLHRWCPFSMSFQLDKLVHLAMNILSSIFVSSTLIWSISASISSRRLWDSHPFVKFCSHFMALALSERPCRFRLVRPETLLSHKSVCTNLRYQVRLLLLVFDLARPWRISLIKRRDATEKLLKTELQQYMHQQNSMFSHWRLSWSSAHISCALMRTRFQQSNLCGFSWTRSFYLMKISL